MRGVIRRLSLAVFVLFAGFSSCTCQKGVPRPGPAFDGSARWAVAQAQPRITAFAEDAQLRTIVGMRLAPDGRMFANVGSWGVTVFSARRQETLQVNVAADGSLTEAIRASTGAGIQSPLPTTWLNSPEAFALARPLVSTFAEATMVTFNLTDFHGDLAGKATWAINTPGGNALISFDGAIARRQ